MQCYDYYYYYGLPKISRPKKMVLEKFKNNNGSNCTECNFNHIAQWQWNSKIGFTFDLTSTDNRMLQTERCRKIIIVIQIKYEVPYRSMIMI